MLIADTHSDTLYNLGCQGQKLEEQMITPDRLRQGGVNLQVFALWSGRHGLQGDYKTIARQEYDAVPRLVDAGLTWLKDPRDAREGQQGFMLSLQGCEVFNDSLQAVDLWRERGVRMGALVWNNPNAIGTPAKVDAKAGLTDWGVQVVRRMQQLGMAVDTSHLNEGGFYDIFARTDKAPLASHSCCRALCDHSRNLTDDQLKLMIREGGYVGMNFYPAFLKLEGRVTCETVAEHIDHICQLGGAGIVGFGSDFDGIECTPEDLRHPGELPNLLDALRRRGYTEQDLAAIAGGNLLAYYDRIS